MADYYKNISGYNPTFSGSLTQDSYTQNSSDLQRFYAASHTGDPNVNAWMNQPHPGEGTVYQYPRNHRLGHTFVIKNPTSPFAGVARSGGRSSRPAFGIIYQNDEELTDEKGNLRTEIMRVNHSRRKNCASRQLC